VAGILAVNPLLCEYSAQARGYALQTLLAVSAYFLFDRWTRGKRDVVVMLAVVCALALWTLPTSVYILFAIFLAALFFVRSGRIAASDWIVLAFTTVTIATLLYAPAVLFRGFLDVYHQGTACPASMLPLAVIRGLQGITNPSAMIVGYSDCTHDWAQNFASLLAASTLQTQGALQIVIVSVFLLGLWHAPKSLQLTGCSLFVGVFLHLVIMKHPPPLRIWSFLVPLSATICACGIIFPLWRMNVQARLVSILCICSVMWYWGVCLPMVKQVQPSQSRAEELARIIAKAISKGDRVSLIQFPDKGRTMYIGPIRYYVIHELAKTDSSWNVWRELQSGELPWHKKPRSEICGTEISALEHEFHPEGRCLFAAYMNDGASHFYNLEPEGGKWIYDSSGFVLGWNVQVTPK